MEKSENINISNTENKDRPKLLYFAESLGGGVFSFLVDISNELVEHFDIYLAYAVRRQLPDNYKSHFDNRIHLIMVKNFSRSLNPLRDLSAFFEIKKIAKKIEPDIIHLHSSKAGALGRWAFNGRKIPMFYTPHGYSFLMADQSGLKRSIYKFIESFCSKRCCTTISCSEGENKETLKLSKRAVYVNNGINIGSLQQLIDSIPAIGQHPFTVFTLGRVCYQKNPELFNEIAKNMPDVKFVWIGDGEMKEKLTSPNIEITGWLDRKDALTKALSADVFLLTSLWEGLPLSLLEAMYMKKTCVVSDVIGNHDAIHNGVNGFVCNELSEYISAINSARAGGTDELIHHAYEDVLGEYNTTVMAQRYKEIYLQSLNKI